MTSRDLLVQTVTRYQQARRWVLDTYPQASESEFRALVREAAQRLAHQEPGREGDALKQVVAAYNLHQAAKSLGRNDDRAAVQYIEQAKQLLGGPESHSVNLALTTHGAPHEIRSLLITITRFQWLWMLEIRKKVIVEVSTDAPN